MLDRASLLIPCGSVSAGDGTASSWDAVRELLASMREEFHVAVAPIKVPIPSAA